MLQNPKAKNVCSAFIGFTPPRLGISKMGKRERISAVKIHHDSLWGFKLTNQRIRCGNFLFPDFFGGNDLN